MSVDGQDTANLTNLALKGILGVRAMAEISHSLEKDDDARSYLVRFVVDCGIFSTDNTPKGHGEIIRSAMEQSSMVF